jgi:hypothetical protein
VLAGEFGVQDITKAIVQGKIGLVVVLDFFSMKTSQAAATYESHKFLPMFWRLDDQINLKHAIFSIGVHEVNNLKDRWDCK